MDSDYAEPKEFMRVGFIELPDVNQDALNALANGQPAPGMPERPKDLGPCDPNPDISVLQAEIEYLKCRVEIIETYIQAIEKFAKERL